MGANMCAVRQLAVALPGGLGSWSLLMSLPKTKDDPCHLIYERRMALHMLATSVCSANRQILPVLQMSMLADTQTALALSCQDSLDDAMSREALPVCAGAHAGRHPDGAD